MNRDLTPYAAYPVIMMCGVSGAGKTFIASQLQAEGYERLSADKIVWKKYGDAYAAMTPAQQHTIYMDAIDAIVASIPAKIAAGKRVVIEASMCKRRRRDQVAQMCRQAGAEYVIVYVSAPREVLRSRLLQRRGSGPDDQRVTEEELDRFLLNFEAPEPDEHFIQI